MNQTTNRLLSGFGKLLSIGGNQVYIKYYQVFNTGIYDDDVTLTQSGNTLWTSGLVFPVNAQSDDAVLIEQGKIGLNDNKIYLAGSLTFSKNAGKVFEIKFGVGSPTGEEYAMIMPGNDVYSNENIGVYQSIYVRRLTGSLLGEV